MNKVALYIKELKPLSNFFNEVFEFGHFLDENRYELNEALVLKYSEQESENIEIELRGKEDIKLILNKYKFYLYRKKQQGALIPIILECKIPLIFSYNSLKFKII